MNLPTADDLFSTQEERDNEKREYVKAIPLDQISDFPNHPFKVRMVQTATFCGQQGRIFRTVQAILSGQPGISAGQRVLRPTDQYCSLFQEKAMPSQSVR